MFFIGGGGGRFYVLEAQPNPQAGKTAFARGEDHLRPFTKPSPRGPENVRVVGPKVGPTGAENFPLDSFSLIRMNPNWSEIYLDQ